MAEESKKKTEIKVSGMHCASCALNVEKSLKDLEGVENAQVNIGTEKATVEYDPEKLKLTELENAIENAGYGVANDHVILKIGGMSCVMCVKAIEEGLGKLDGISDVNVNLTSEKAYVTYNPKMVTVEDMGINILALKGKKQRNLKKR